MKFSVALIAKDEAKTLPKLLESLKAFTEKGGEVVILDTGSTDGTPDLARSLGCKVTEVGDKYVRTITKEQADAINEPMLRNGEGPGVSEGDRCFDFAAARNAAAELASNDFVMTPDCDESVKLDIEKLEALLADDVSLVWCKIHAGTMEWNTTRFYHRKKMKWSGITHEWLSGPGRHAQADLDTFSLYHHQEHKDERPKRILGLALDALLHDTPRSLFYYGRDLVWRGKPKTAIEVLRRQLEKKAWAQEQAEGLAFIGDAYAALGQEDNAYQAWWTSWLTCPTRRVGLMRAAKYAYDKVDWQKVAVFATAALQIKYNASYIEDMATYAHAPYEYLYPAVWQLGRKDDSRVFFKEALRLNPENPKTIADKRWYSDPFVSIIIPHLPTPERDEKLKRCIESIKENANYDDYEIIVENDSWEDNQGCPKTLARGVEKAKGDLIMFMGNDVIAQPRFLSGAVESMRVHFPNMDGLIGLDDMLRGDDLATCWLGSKKLLPLIGGEFFHTGYYHCFGDNELIERAKLLGKYYFDKSVKVKHEWGARTKDDPVYKLAYKQERWDHDQALYFERRKTFRPHVFDCFTYMGEDDLLDLRFAELNDFVDRFVIVEATKTFSGKDRKTLFNRERFPQYADKITYVVVDDMPEGSAWDRERHQRNAIARGLKNCQPNDIIIISDVDEIPSPKAISEYRPEMGIRSLEMRMYYYWMNCYQQQWAKAKILPFRALSTPDEVRYLPAEVIKDGGWHFSYLGGVEAIVNKLEAFSHQEYNTEEMKDKKRIAKKIREGKDLFDRPYEYKFVAIDSTFPTHVNMLSKHIHA